MSIYNLTDKCPDSIWQEFDIDSNDLSLNDQEASALEYHYDTDMKTFNRLFMSKYNLEYITDYFLENRKSIRIISYPKTTNTCYEKAHILHNWNPLNVIKALYLESSDDGSLYAVIVPETGCFLDRDFVRRQLNLPEDVVLNRATSLPDQMSFGSCSPFIRPEDSIKLGGKVKAIIFDKETLVLKRYENKYDDFSFGLEHRFSIQMNYYDCFKMLKHMFDDIVLKQNILSLSFKEKFVRKKGRIRINYDFESLNYRTAKFINDIHGYSDVSIINDHIDELCLPDVLTLTAR